MSIVPDSLDEGKASDLATGMAARAAQIVIAFALQAAVLFLAAGSLAWMWAWVFLVIYVLSVVVNSLLLLRTNAGTIAERGRPKEMKDWDKAISGVWSLAQFLLIPLIAGLDFRFGFSENVGLIVHLAGAMLFVFGLAFFGWAMIENAYFSTVVRIQTDRGQTVCRSGPYRFVRHPGYVGTLLQSAGAPLLLGSWWALLAGALAAGCMVLRTSLEDRTLMAELPGYDEYARQIRYRLILGIW